MAPADDGPDVSLRADLVRTKRDAVSLALRRRSVLLLLVATASIVAARAVAAAAGGRATLGVHDVAVVAVTFALAGPVEWLVHRGLLHADPTSWRATTLRTGQGHARHHDDPGDVRWAMLRTSDVVVFVTALGAFSALWVGTVASLVSTVSSATVSSMIGPGLTAWAAACVALVHYEWTHLLVHTRVRLRTPVYRRLARHHRMHHHRDATKWLGVTTNTGDRLFSTLPRSRPVAAPRPSS